MLNRRRVLGVVILLCTFAAIAYADQPYMRAARTDFTLATSPDQPHMQAALDNLLQAKSNLERATSDKGGYRVKAIDEVNKAIDETKKGIDAGE